MGDADTDDKAVLTVELAWKKERQAEQQEWYNHINTLYQEEFARRQKEIEEQNWFIMMEEQQRAADKLWN